MKRYVIYTIKKYDKGKVRHRISQFSTPVDLAYARRCIAAHKARDAFIHRLCYKQEIEEEKLGILRLPDDANERQKIYAISRPKTIIGWKARFSTTVYVLLDSMEGEERDVDYIKGWYRNQKQFAQACKVGYLTLLIYRGDRMSLSCQKPGALDQDFWDLQAIEW